MHTDYCGEFEDTGYEEFGQCFPLRVVRDCEAPLITIRFTNQAQTVVNQCAEGSGVAIITVTIPIGSYSSTVSQADANAQAYAAAMAQAVAEREANPCYYYS